VNLNFAGVAPVGIYMWGRNTESLLQRMQHEDASDIHDYIDESVEHYDEGSSAAATVSTPCEPAGARFRRSSADNGVFGASHIDDTYDILCAFPESTAPHAEIEDTTIGDDDDWPTSTGGGGGGGRRNRGHVTRFDLSATTVHVLTPTPSDDDADEKPHRGTWPITYIDGDDSVEVGPPHASISGEVTCDRFGIVPTDEDVYRMSVGCRADDYDDDAAEVPGRGTVFVDSQGEHEIADVRAITASWIANGRCVDGDSVQSVAEMSRDDDSTLHGRRDFDESNRDVDDDYDYDDDEETKNGLWRDDKVTEFNVHMYQVRARSEHGSNGFDGLEEEEENPLSGSRKFQKDYANPGTVTAEVSNLVRPFALREHGALSLEDELNALC
jgi:hypothetical protein